VTGSTEQNGELWVIGLGPADSRWLTPEASTALAAAHVLYGYGPYLDRIPARPDQERVASDNREEAARAAAALEGASSGERVAMISGGDPGVFAMAAAVCEQIERGPSRWRELDVHVLPGVTAMLAVAARVGAPLGNDFCAISLSDNRKPWELVEARLDAAAAAGFVIALYNPISRARPWQLGAALGRLAKTLPPTTPVVFGRAVGRPDERIRVVELQHAPEEPADMSTLVLIGGAETRIVERPGRAPLVYTPRTIPFELQAESPHSSSEMRSPAPGASDSREAVARSPQDGSKSHEDDGEPPAEKP